MTDEDDWQLPAGYWAEHHTDGRVTLWLDEAAVQEFRGGTPQKAIEALAAAYAKGRQAGEASGQRLGRAQLAAEFRTLLAA